MNGRPKLPLTDPASDSLLQGDITSSCKTQWAPHPHPWLPAASWFLGPGSHGEFREPCGALQGGKEPTTSVHPCLLILQMRHLLKASPTVMGLWSRGRTGLIQSPWKSTHNGTKFSEAEVEKHPLRKTTRASGDRGRTLVSSLRAMRASKWL